MTLVSSSALDVLETFRVPYAVEDERAHPASGRVASTRGAELLWVAPVHSTPRAWHRIGAISVYGAVAAEPDVRRALEASAHDWQSAESVLDPAGSPAAYVWRASDGSSLLPFDPDALVRAFLREEYLDAGTARSFVRSFYYRIRPVLPRSVQMAARRRFARVQERASFPSWPAETALHDLYRFLLALVEEVHGAPLPWIAPWPTPHRWVVVLTHDVEQANGYRHVEAVAAVEREAGVRSAWYFVPERDYRVDDTLVASLALDGFEVGVHGLRHDGRDLSPGTFEERLPAMRTYAEQWGAVGFRAPATQRGWEQIGELGFDHDSSYSDVARYEPQAGGSCSWLPFFIGDVVELPITLPMDHTLFELLGSRDGEMWFEKAAFLRERGGMALLLTHPDYLAEPHRLAEYERFVTHVAGDSGAWLTLPREIASWWRRRSQSSLELSSDVWRVTGPAAREARVIVGVSGGV